MGITFLDNPVEVLSNRIHGFSSFNLNKLTRTCPHHKGYLGFFYSDHRNPFKIYRVDTKDVKEK